MKRRPGGVKGKTQRLEGKNPPLIETSGVKITHASVDRGIHRSTRFIQLEHDGTQTNRVLRNAATWVIEALKMTSTTTKPPTAKFKIGDIVPFAPGGPGKTVEAFSIRVPSKLWPNADALNRATLIAGRLALTGRNPRESEEGTGTYTKLLVQDLPRAQGGHEDAQEGRPAGCDRTPEGDRSGRTKNMDRTDPERRRRDTCRTRAPRGGR